MLTYLHALTACGTLGLTSPPSDPESSGGDPGQDDTSAVAIPAEDATRTPAVRRLTPLEIDLALTDLFGSMPGVSDGLLPNNDTHLFDTVAEDQTVSANQVAAWWTSADQVTAALRNDPELLADHLACDADLLPPSEPPTLTTVPGELLACDPSWMCTVESDGVMRMYYGLDELHIEWSVDVGEGGLHELTMEGWLQDYNKEEDEILPIDVTSAGLHYGQLLFSGTKPMADSLVLDLPPGNHLLDLVPTEPLSGNVALNVQTVSLEGPLSASPLSADELRTCAVETVLSVADQAWRRPLTDTLRAQLTATVDAALAAREHWWDGPSAGMQAVLMSPRFLYLNEQGTPVDGQTGVYRLDDHELAARLALFTTGSLPDTELRGAAAAGDLVSNPDELRRQAARLLATERGQAQVARFVADWLDLDAIDSLNKDLDAYPLFTEEVRTAMRAETEDTLRELIWAEGGGTADLFGSELSWVPEALEEIYEVNVASEGPTSLPTTRAGILTHPGLMAATAHQAETAPVRRGLFVLERFLCTELPDPPDDLDITVPPFDASLSTRERYAQHSSDPACAGCHNLIDPIGFAMEDMDPIGQVRDWDGEHPVDASGGIPSLGIAADELWGAAEVGLALADSEEATACVARQWMRFGLGRLDDGADLPSIEALADADAEAGLLGLLQELVATPAFQHRIIPEEQP